LVHPESNEVISVCKVFFLTTFGFYSKNDAVVMSVMSATPRNASTAAPDKRGKHTPSNKMDVTEIRQRILFFYSQVSHYRREHAPERRYLPNDLTIRSMHDDYLEKSSDNSCSYKTYRKCITAENISFTKLGEEHCEVCMAYYNSHDSNTCKSRQSKDNENGQSRATDANCDACLKWRGHIKRAREARRIYRHDADEKWSDEYSVRSADLQKVIIIPRMPGCKTAAFTSRMVAFNETFALMGKQSKSKKKHLAVTWHKAIAKRKAEEIASAYLKALKYDRKVKHVIYWLDNCAAQNKNWSLFTLLACLVNSSDIEADDIVLKYFETGHTFMSADSVHHGIEDQIRKLPGGNVCDFDDLCEVFRQSNSGKVEVLTMTHKDFYDVKGEHSLAKLKRKNRPKLADMVEVKFCRGSRSLFFKKEFAGSYSEFDFLKKSCQLTMTNRPLHDGPRGIPVPQKQPF